MDRVIVSGVVALLGAGLRSSYREAQKTKRRKSTPVVFNDDLPQRELAAIGRMVGKSAPRIESVSINGATIDLRVRSNSGLSSWEAQIDFNDYGRLTGSYWLSSENRDSLVPEFVADAIQDQVRQRLSGASQERAVPATWAVDPWRRHEMRFWDGARWTHHVADQGRVSLDAIG